MAAFTDLGPHIAGNLQRIVDLRPCIADHVYHPTFGGSFPIKTVLPALVPDLSYQQLAIREGDTAITRFAQTATSALLQAGHARDGQAARSPRENGLRLESERMPPIFPKLPGRESCMDRPAGSGEGAERGTGGRGSHLPRVGCWRVSLESCRHLEG